MSTMLLVHQTGSVKIGEVVRYTVTYKPSADHILPSPEFLYLRIKNTSAIALRAAFVHGPYTLSVAAYPSTFKPFEKFEDPRRYGVPEFEPMLKAGAVWNCHLAVPDNIRQAAGEGSSKHGHFGAGPEHNQDSVSWVIEIASQVIFSSSASVHYEILLARDEKSLNLGSALPVLGGQVQASQPGRVSDFQQSAGASKHHPAQPKGVFSKAVHLKVEDTAALWNTPQLPGWDDMGWLRARESEGGDAPVEPATKSGKPESARPWPKNKQIKVHLVVVTHGLHSNLGSDMLFLKESIDAAVKQARIDAKARKARERAARRRASSGVDASTEAPERSSQTPTPTPPGTEKDASGSHNGQEDDGKGGEDGMPDNDGDVDDDDDDEEVIVRGFSGNATKTEKGIKYLGKRLARYILSMTYPDQPCLPTAKAASEAIAHTLKTSAQSKAAEEVHRHSSVHQGSSPGGKRLYKFTKISFIGHSLGGLVQTYAVAYIQKHSPQFFGLIEPVNFIALASPFLGLNHENPLYVKFALDFGLVGRTGQDLGLTWRAPTIARNGWGALVSNLGEQAQKRVYGETQPESKPLLRILPTGPAHKALKRFRNRTVYSNVVNDGIVPLRTSCLLFLDWQGLGRVEKARREAGLVETVVGFGWAELTGATATTPRLVPWSPVEVGDKDETTGGSDKTTPPRRRPEDSHEVPQPPTNAMVEDDQESLRPMTSSYRELEPTSSDLQHLQSSSTTNSFPFAGIFNFFRSETPKHPPAPSPKVTKIYQRSQTLKPDALSASDSATSSKSRVTSGNELTEETESMTAPPRTTIFESAGDLLNPKLPSVEFLIDPSKRPRTIFHDRVYHPSDIPPPPLKQRSSSPLNLRRRTQNSSSSRRTTQSEASSAPSPPPPGHKGPSAAQPSYHRHNASGGDGSTIHTDTSDKDIVATPPADTNTNEVADFDIDTSQMRVEEKIARAYHRGLSWRKVLVKLEPDAHNNIIVRRTFANAFGWPVIEHLVQAHFSDTAIARRRDEDEPNVDRVKKITEGPDEQGRETRDHGMRKNAKGEGVTVGGNDEAAERGEEGDIVPELPKPSPRSENGSSRGVNALGVFAPAAGPGFASPTTPRPTLDRLDSVTWSDRDWVDSEGESDEGAHWRSRKKEAGADSAGKRGTSGERSSSPLMWNWTEKIVGKGIASRSKSPAAGDR
ncbi:putative serine esterase-domain-containing protein [Chaetomium strumarium]|uniref:Serine esterase-domain-containing protein n=1 Tax=Chaetomium strumarium TaxID=1170767 RepID=A0AAJ0GVN0_9PEZI|nr:putative serine esterase-domain-containing protein [Chaetomium strumarium]